MFVQFGLAALPFNTISGREVSTILLQTDKVERRSAVNVKSIRVAREGRRTLFVMPHTPLWMSDAIERDAPDIEFQLRFDYFYVRFSSIARKKLRRIESVVFSD